MIRYFIALAVIAAAIVSGLSLLVGTGFDALLAAVQYRDREQDRVGHAAGSVPSGTPANSPLHSRAVLVESPAIPVPMSTDAVPAHVIHRLGMSGTELRALRGRPLQERNDGAYVYWTYPDIRYVLRRGDVIGWSEP